MRSVLSHRFSLIAIIAACALIPHALHAQRKNIGDSINTQWNEIIPIISANGKTLYFDRKEYPKNVGGNADKDDIWYSELLPDGTWSRAKNLVELNTRSPNAIFSILPDNNTALYWGAIDSTGRITFAIVQRTEDGWGKPRLLHIKNFYNRSDGITASLAADGNTLLMGIRRDDSPGGVNIYVSFLEDEETNSWSEPKSLGPHINTKYGEASPLLGADMSTLFFSSGRPSANGSVNIYQAQRLDSTWTNWSEPVDMGSEFNILGENYLNSITASGEYAYLTGMVENPNKNLDIFRIKVPEDKRIRPVVLLQGKVYRAAKNGKKDLAHPLAARLVYERLRDGKQVGVANTNPKSGSYEIALPGGEEYGIRVESDGCLPQSDHLDVRDLLKYTEMTRDFALPVIAVGSNISLNNIFFDFAKATLRPESQAELNRFASMMSKNPAMRVVIEGHTDDVGTDQANDALSQARAQSVKNYLTGRGVNGARIEAHGYGKRQPVAPNDTEENRGKNRRVVFRITSK